MFNPSAPTADALHDAASAGYDSLRNMSVDYAPASIVKQAHDALADLKARGLLDIVAPSTNALMGRVAADSGAQSAVPLTDILAVRQALGRVAGVFSNPSDQLAAMRAKALFDQFLGAPPQGAVLAGPADQVASTLADANGNYAAAARSDAINGIDRAAELRTNAANSGMNLGNSIRSRVASLLLNPKAVAGFSPEEVAALEAVNRGSTAANVLRTVGNILGGGGGLGSMVTSGAGALAGASAGGPIGGGVGAVALPVAGRIAKIASNQMTASDLAAVDAATRWRSPMGDALGGGAPNAVQAAVTKAAPDLATLLARGAIWDGVTQPQPQGIGDVFGQRQGQPEPQGLGGVFAQ